VASGIDSAFSTAGNGEVTGSDRVSLACDTDAVAGSKETLGRPRKGMVSEKRLADGFKDDEF